MCICVSCVGEQSRFDFIKWMRLSIEKEKRRNKNFSIKLINSWELKINKIWRNLFSQIGLQPVTNNLLLLLLNKLQRASTLKRTTKNTRACVVYWKLTQKQHEKSFLRYVTVSARSFFASKFNLNSTLRTYHLRQLLINQINELAVAAVVPIFFQCGVQWRDLSTGTT